MSKGSPIVPIRVPTELLNAIDQAIESRNDVTRDEPDTRTSWILKAIRMRLAHRRRSNRKRSKPAEGPTDLGSIVG